MKYFFTKEDYKLVEEWLKTAKKSHYDGQHLCPWSDVVDSCDVEFPPSICMFKCSKVFWTCACYSRRIHESWDRPEGEDFHKLFWRDTACPCHCYDIETVLETVEKFLWNYRRLKINGTNEQERKESSS